MKGARTTSYGTPWRRLPVTGPLALATCLLASWVLAAVMLRSPHSQQRPAPIDARFIELPAPEEPIRSIQPSPVAHRTPPTLSTQKRQLPRPDQASAAVSEATLPAPEALTISSSAQVPRENIESGLPKGQPIFARHPEAGRRAKSIGVIPPPDDLSIHNEETTINPDGLGVRTGGWQQEYNETCDPFNTWDRSCGLEYFSQQPTPWCYDANPFMPWENGSCANELGQAVALYKRKDYPGALAKLRKLAEKDFAPAQADLGTMYAEGKGVPQDDQQAVYWWRRAAADGNAKAVYNLALAYADGKGIAKDEKQAAHWNRKAAYYGYAIAQYNLAVMYASGTGIPKDDKQAAFWYRKAADRGNALAQYSLGVMYAEGAGTVQDFQKAVYWYRKAADRGHAAAQYHLGVMYAEGQGIKKDEAMAYFWWVISSAQGHELAEESRDILEKRLDPQQLDQALNAARAWKRK